ncbi:hypothetical protein BKA56DRAFT_616936 [Ilyonectria sp. MPI-CAGE-AT-0026]|nr:hypothetical protein BKA56DRAFT_616936 [Ilyonectria sp. MPI-CAGE-AT-0026]
MAPTARQFCTAPGRSPVSQGPGRDMARLPEQQCARPNGDRRVTKGVAYRASAALSRGSMVVSEHVDVDGMSRRDPTYTPDLWSVSGPCLARAPADRRGTPHAHSRCMRLSAPRPAMAARATASADILEPRQGARHQGTLGLHQDPQGSPQGNIRAHQSLLEPTSPPVHHTHAGTQPRGRDASARTGPSPTPYPRPIVPSFIYRSPAYADRAWTIETALGLTLNSSFMRADPSEAPKLPGLHQKILLPILNEVHFFLNGDLGWRWLTLTTDLLSRLVSISFSFQEWTLSEPAIPAKAGQTCEIDTLEGIQSEMGLEASLWYDTHTPLRACRVSRDRTQRHVSNQLGTEGSVWAIFGQNVVVASTLNTDDINIVVDIPSCHECKP